MNDDTKSMGAYSKATGQMSSSTSNTYKSGNISKIQMHQFFEKGFQGIQNDIN